MILSYDGGFTLSLMIKFMMIFRWSFKFHNLKSGFYFFSPIQIRRFQCWLVWTVFVDFILMCFVDFILVCFVDFILMVFCWFYSVFYLFHSNGVLLILFWRCCVDFILMCFFDLVLMVFCWFNSKGVKLI